MKHTKGDWKIIKAITYIWIKSDDKLIAMIDSLKTSALNECEANAKLIAAAPKLLEALIWCSKKLKEKDGIGLDDINNRMIKEIKKATQ